MSKLADALDPLNIFHKKKKKIVEVPKIVAAKEGSEAEVARRRQEAANRLRSRSRTTLPGGFGSDDERKSTLLGD